MCHCYIQIKMNKTEIGLNLIRNKAYKKHSLSAVKIISNRKGSFLNKHLSTKQVTAND